MLTDVVAVFMGLAAVMLAKRGSTSPDRTYGWHRAEVFTAVANAVAAGRGGAVHPLRSDRAASEGRPTCRACR